MNGVGAVERIQVSGGLDQAQPIPTAVPISQLLRERHPDIFSEDPRLSMLPGGINETYCCDVSAKKLVVRLSPVNILLGDASPNATGWSRYHKEMWACRIAALAGLQTPEVLHVGYFDPNRFPLFANSSFAARSDLPSAYMIQDYVPGHQLCTWYGFLADPQLMKISGQLARQIHTIATEGYGTVFDTEHCRFTANSWLSYWQDTLGDNFFDRARKLNVLEAPTLETIKRTFDEVTQWDFTPRLMHGDLRPENILSSPNGHVVIDWERARSGPSPEWEIAMLLLESHPLQDHCPFFEAFLSGLQVEPREYKEKYERRVKMLALLTVLPEWVRMESVRQSLTPERQHPLLDPFSPQQFCYERRINLSRWLEGLTRDLSKV